jgi:hypothetical protein
MRKLVLTLILCLCTVGCIKATAPTPPLPGALNSFDQTSYQTLVTAQASLNDFKASVTKDPNLATLKPALNQAVQDYDIAEVAWQTYHAAASAVNQAAVTAALDKVQGDVVNLQKASK